MILIVRKPPLILGIHLVCFLFLKLLCGLCIRTLSSLINDFLILRHIFEYPIRTNFYKIHLYYSSIIHELYYAIWYFYRTSFSNGRLFLYLAVPELRKDDRSQDLILQIL